MCVMCKKHCMGQNQYILETYGILPKTPSEELGVCIKCVMREVGLKKKQYVDDYLGS